MMLLKLTSPTQNAVLETIAKLNVDSSVHGILLLNPLASHLQSKHLTNAIIPTKDVDCHCDFNQRMLSELKELSPLLPTVCQSVFFTLDINCFDPTGKRVVVANDNRRIGLPLCDLLRNRHCHVSNYGIGNCQGMEEAATEADFLITAIGQHNKFKRIKSGAVVINFGVSRSNDGKLYGDVAEEALSQAQFYTPVFNGIGPVTTGMLAFNLLICWARRPLTLY